MLRRMLIGGALLVLCVSHAWGTIRTVSLHDSTIYLPAIGASPGDTVRWNVVAGTHYLVSDSISPFQWNSDTLSGFGSSFDLIIPTTDTTGTLYRYHCALHPSITYQIRIGIGFGCCLPPYRGNVDYSVETGFSPYGINVQDLNYMVAYFFSGGPAPVCLQEADINGNGAIGVIDLNYLVAYMFSGGPRPAACP